MGEQFCTECKGSGFMPGSRRGRSGRRDGCIECMGTGRQISDAEWDQRHTRWLDRQLPPLEVDQ